MKREEVVQLLLSASHHLAAAAHGLMVGEDVSEAIRHGINAAASARDLADHATAPLVLRKANQ